MILVTDLKIAVTHDKDRYFPYVELYRHPPLVGVYDPRSDEDPFTKPIEVTIEQVRGQKFINRFGIPVVIGWDKATQEALGLPFDVYESMERRRKSDYEENTRLRKKLRELREMSLWKYAIKKITKRLS